MLKGYKILKAIPAYDFSNSELIAIKEKQEEYIRETTLEYDLEKVIKVIKLIIRNYNNSDEGLFVLNLILDNPHLLKKTRFVLDGSFRNIRVCAYNNIEDFGYIKKRHYISLEIKWKNVIGKKMSCKELEDLNKYITKDDIVEVLNNIEEIFIQDNLVEWDDDKIKKREIETKFGEFVESSFSANNITFEDSLKEIMKNPKILVKLLDEFHEKENIEIDYSHSTLDPH